MVDYELDSSKLGTLEHMLLTQISSYLPAFDEFKRRKKFVKCSCWEEVYSKEIENFSENGDEGEVWFGIQSVKRVLNWLKTKNYSKNSSIIDIGCGNGVTCCMLAGQGYTDITGIDYSDKAINLAKSIRDQKELKTDYQVVDCLNKDEYPKRKFQIAIDKGTYDAIALCPIDPKTKRLLYKEFLCSIMMPNSDSILIITSCNWTTKELIDFFTLDDEFVILEEIKSQANFAFGGATGSTTSTVVFKFNPK